MNETTPNIPRLRKLLRAVESAPAKLFSMDGWICGTSACAVGWYAIKCPEEGVQIIDDDLFFPEHDRNCGQMTPIVGRHFGMTPEQAFQLFITGNEKRNAWLRQYRRWLVKHAPAALEPEPTPDTARSPGYTLTPSVLAARANAEHLRAAEDEGDAERRGYVDRWADDDGDALAVAERPSRWEQE